MINRGSTSNEPYELVPYVPLSPRSYAYMMLAQGPADVLEIAWTQGPHTGTEIRHNFQMQRLMPPTDGSSEYTALTNIVDIVANDEVALFKTTDFVHTGDDTMMALWAGDVSGDYDVYAAPIDLQACP